MELFQIAVAEYFTKRGQTIKSSAISKSEGGEAFVKKILKDCLVSLNPKYKTNKLYENDEFRIFGKVIGAY